MFEQRTIRRIAWAALAGMMVLAAWAIRPGAAEPPATTQPGGGTIKITILHVNDPHGRLEPWSEDGKSYGGYARLSTLASEVRSTGLSQRVFLVHAGDEFSKGDELTSRTSGEANIGVLNHLKFDLWTPGNGDFYDGLRNLQARMKQASFPTLAANVIVKSSGQRVGRPFLIEKVGDVQIAFLGLCTLRTNLPSAWPVRLDDPIETAKNFVPQFRKDTDVVVAVTHIGYEKDVELAKTVPGIDLIIGGHSHTKLDTGEIVRGPGGKDVLICQAGEHLQYAGRVDLSLKPAGTRFQLVGATARLIPLDEKIKLDPEVTALIAKMSGASSQPATAPSASRPAVRPTTRPAALKPAGTISTGR